MKTSVFLCFFLLGLSNNIIYVIILTGALALLGPECPKGWVLLCDIGPSFLVKLIAPYIIDGAAHRNRVIQCVAAALAGVFVIAASSTTLLILFGISLASYASGLGEMNYLMLSTRHSNQAMKGFATGTGAAGLIGSLSWLALTKWAALDVTLCLLIFASAPVVMALAYFALPSENDEGERGVYDSVVQDPSAIRAHAANEPMNFDPREMGLKEKLSLARPLLVKFMLPLFLVYWAEYTINQGVTSTLVYPPRPPLLPDLASYYPTWITLYQLGVFMARASITWRRLDHHLLIYCSLLQCVILGGLTMESMYNWLGSWAIILIALIILLEGTLGGLVYVNAYTAVREAVWADDKGLEELYKNLAKSKAFREFSMSIVGVADVTGILLASVISIFLEPSLCSWQVSRGRPFCKSTSPST